MPTKKIWKRSPSFNYEEMGLIDRMLYFGPDRRVTCRPISKRKVEYQGKQMSQVEAARRAAKSLGLEVTKRKTPRRFNDSNFWETKDGTTLGTYWGNVLRWKDRRANQGNNTLRSLSPEDNKILDNHARSLFKDVKNASPERREVIREIIKRDSRQAKILKARLDGICQLCGTKPFNGKFGDITEAHHIVWLSDDGPDRLDNMVLLCPNHHAAIHAIKAKFRRSELRFFRGEKSLYLKQAGHLKNSRGTRR